MDTIWLWYAFVSALVVFSFSPRLYEICWLLFYPRTAESVWSISVIGEWRCCGPVGRSCSALSLFHLPLHPDLLHLQHLDLHHQTTWELIWSEHSSRKSNIALENIGNRHNIARCYLTILLIYGSYNEKIDFLPFQSHFSMKISSSHTGAMKKSNLGGLVTTIGGEQIAPHYCKY